MPGDAEAEALAEDGNIAEIDDAELTGDILHAYIIKHVGDKTLLPQQALLMQKKFKIARASELETPERLLEAKEMIDTYILENQG